MDGAERPTILKRDALGRVSMSREQRETLLDEFERSTLKGAPFCPYHRAELLDLRLLGAAAPDMGARLVGYIYPGSWARGGLLLADRNASSPMIPCLDMGLAIRTS